MINEWAPSKGGAESLLNNLHNNWDTNFEIYNVSLIKPKDFNIDFISNNGLYHISTVWKLFIWLKGLSKRTIIHCHLFPTFYYVSFFKLIGVFHGKLVFTEHNTYNKRRKWFFQHIEKIIYSQFEQIICISEGAQKSIVDWIPSIKDKTRLVYNGTTISKRKITFQFQNDLNGIKILSVGRLVKQKNYLRLLKIMAPLLKSTESLLTLAGEGDEREYLTKKISRLKLEKKIILLGRVENINTYYLKSDIFILLSSWEGFGISLVEALSFGLRVIVSKVPGMREIVEPIIGNGVLMVDLNDSDEIIRKRIELFMVEHDSEENYLTRINRAKMFDIKNTADSYMNVYKQINNSHNQNVKL